MFWRMAAELRKEEEEVARYLHIAQHDFRYKPPFDWQPVVAGFLTAVCVLGPFYLFSM